jgi:hypothetical protein
LTVKQRYVRSFTPIEISGDSILRRSGSANGRGDRGTGRLGWRSRQIVIFAIEGQPERPKKSIDTVSIDRNFDLEDFDDGTEVYRSP